MCLVFFLPYKRMIPIFAASSKTINSEWNFRKRDGPLLNPEMWRRAVCNFCWIFSFLFISIKIFEFRIPALQLILLIITIRIVLKIETWTENGHLKCVKTFKGKMLRYDVIRHVSVSWQKSCYTILTTQSSHQLDVYFTRRAQLNNASFS